MNRLLHGDVGSGKTVVAASAMLAAVEAGFQAALMAPTQILAEQHYANLKRWCEPLGVRVGLRTGNRREESGPLPLFDHDRWLRGHVEGTGDRPELPTTVPQILVGTHALLFEEDAFERLGVVVIDEQHKFGVLQRARLRGKGRVPDVLVMTATPIPRTMTMSVYGDLDVSTLDELPSGRGRVVTAVRDAGKLADAVDFFRGFLESGRQLYIVYPLVDESEKMPVKSAVKEHERWVEVWKPFECGLLHGRMSPEEKEAVMGRFRGGELRVLVATTVIEVGIDVANANLMLIENSERFGLAQLHQLRGRIGRGAHKGYCVLLTSTDDPEARDKLRVLERTANGFEIAEADWELRGPGDVFGTAQSGIAPVRIGNLVRDAELMQRARGSAFVLMERDPALESLENRRYRVHLEMAGRKADLADVS
jgi:ATP-dependent DNA helicase RecG